MVFVTTADHNVPADALIAVAFVLAAELRAHGVDLSFTPVLDLDYGCCRAIGNRAFHRDPQAVAALAQALVIAQILIPVVRLSFEDLDAATAADALGTGEGYVDTCFQQGVEHGAARCYRQAHSAAR